MKRSIRRIVQQLGWEVNRAGWEGWGPEKLGRLGQPATVIDVGVCDGTPELYAAFPDAFLLLIDPLAESEPSMQDALQGRRGAYALVALGETPGHAHLNVTIDRSASSVAERVGKLFDVEETRQVDVTRLDDLVQDYDLPAPFLLKIDTEGHELAVLRGATQTLARTECVIAEISVAERFVEGYRFADIVRLLDDHGFRLVDLLTVRRDARSRQVLRVDAAFARN